MANGDGGLVRIANFLPGWLVSSALVVSYLARQEVDVLLDSLTSVSGHWFRDGVTTSTVTQVLESWMGVSGEGVRTPYEIAQIHAVLDTVFVVLLSLLLLRTLRPGGFVDSAMRCKGHVQPSDEKNYLIIWAIALLAIGLVADFYENLGIYLLGGAETKTTFEWVWPLGMVKLLIVFPLVVVLFYAVPRAWNAVTSDTARHAWKTARLHILASVVAVALALLPLQLLDVYLGLSWSQLFWLTLTLFPGSLFLGLSSRILIDGDLLMTDDEVKGGWRIVWYSTAALLAAVGLATGARGLVALAAILGAIGLLAIFSSKGADVSPDLPSDGPRSLMAPAFFALIPVVALGVGAIRNTFWFAVYREPIGMATLVSILGVVAVILSARFYVIAFREDAEEDGPITRVLMRLPDLVMTPAAAALKWVTERRGRYNAQQVALTATGLVILILPSIIIAATSASSPNSALGTAANYGPLAIGIAWATVAVAIASVIVLALDGAVGIWGLPRMFSVLGFKHVPVVTIGVVWLVFNSTYLDAREYYNARITDAPSAQPNELQEHLCAWLPEDAQTRSLCGTDNPDVFGTKPAIPMLLFGAEGGGIRAAAWTAEMLDRLDHTDREAFIHSGVSGGSVGFAAFYATNQLLDATPTAFDRLSDDHLSPTLAWGLFRDLPEAFLRVVEEDAIDRAEIMERSFVEAFAGDSGPLNDQLRSLNGKAAYVLNSSGVNSACHILLTPLNLSLSPNNPQDNKEFDCVGLAEGEGVPVARVVQSADLSDVCPQQDMRLITAAVLSARFPFISPAGRIDCGQGVLHGVDGGYVDNTGNTVYNAIWPELARLINEHNRMSATCIVPIAVQIDNGAEVRVPAERDEGNVRQLTAPLSAIFNVVITARDTKVRGAWSDVMNRPLPVGLDPDIAFKANGDDIDTHYFRLFPKEQPGKDASLGWIVSPASKDLLSLQAAETFTDQATRHLLSYLAEDALTCERA